MVVRSSATSKNHRATGSRRFGHVLRPARESALTLINHETQSVVSSQCSASLVDDKYYEVARPGSFGEALTIRARNRIYDDFIRICGPKPEETVLDVGVSDAIGNGPNVLERQYPYPEHL